MGKTTRALERDEIHRLFAAIEGKFAVRNRTMLICGISMALRATELVSLNVGDVRDTNGQIKTYVTIRPETAKFEKKRQIRIGEKVKSALKGFIEYKRSTGESIEDDAPLFVSRKSGHMTRQALFALMRKIFDKAAIDESCHALRKTGATAYYVESNYDLLATQDFLGHNSPSTTRAYIGLDTSKLIAYSESLSEFLFAAISDESDTIGEMTNSLKAYSDNDLLIELQKRGHDVSEVLHRIHARELKASKVVSIDAAQRMQ
jgi:integrase